MAQYRAKVVCFVDNSLREEGEVFEYKGPENTNLELVQSEVDHKDRDPKRGPRRPTDAE